ncbi:MAG: gluconokinase, partial [Rhizobacter sp.]|nr:gluconokinase [Rhizobacter sp.]
VASCSALRQHYRDLLRRSTPALKFVYLRITQSQALERVRERSGHYMPPELVRSQFDALEPPTDEDGVIAVEAEWPTPLQVRTVLAWLEAPDAIPPPHTHR